nr:DUF551 domain-containing protein [Klebsiella variicola]
MTKSTITRERAQQIFLGNGPEPSASEERELARMALAAMDSEPVAEVVSIYGDPEAFGEREIRPLVGIQQMPYGTKLYRHAQQPVLPEEVNAEDCPALVKYDVTEVDEAWARGFNACRATMLQELQKSAGAEVICRSNENAQVLHTISPTQSDCCPAQNSVAPAQGGNSLVIPNEMTSEQAYEIGYYYGDPVDVFARGANWMRQHIIDSTLAAAPQLPGSDPATVPGKWIPVSERMPESNKFVLVSNGVWVGQGLYDDSEHLESDEHWQDEHREFINVLHHPVTHWMPLPAAPQEVKP